MVARKGYFGKELDNASLIGRTENNLEPLEIMFDAIISNDETD